MKKGKFVVKYRWLIITVSFVVSIVFGLQIFRAEIDPDLEKYIPPEMSSRLSTEKIEEIFGGDDMLIIVFETDDVLKERTLQRLKNIRKEIKELKHFDRILSLYDIKKIESEYGAMVVDPAVRRIPKTDLQRELLREELLKNEMALDVVVSNDFTLTALILSLNQSVIDKEVVGALEEVLENNPGNEKVYLGGLPYIKTVITGEIASDFKLLMIIGLVIMLGMLYVFFREIRGVLLPFTIVILAIMFSMGLLPMLGWKLSIITLLLPIMLIAIANDYGIHLMARYQELNWTHPALTNGSLAKKTFSSLRNPIVLTGVTTIAGILCLLSHQMIPARQLGVVAASGIAFALILSLLLIPAILSIIKKSNHSDRLKNGKKHGLDRLLEYFGIIVSKHPLKVVLVAVLVALISGAGAFMLKVDTNLENFFPEKHPVKISSKIINESFGGSQNLSILVNGDVKDPEVMSKIDNYEQQLKHYPGVGNVVSIASVVREISKAMNEPGDSLYDVIPGTREAIAQYLELYNMSGDPEDLEKLIDFDYQNAQIIVRINDGSNVTINNVVGKIKEITRTDSHVSGIGGYGLVVAELAGLVVMGQVISLIIAVLVITFIISLIFRSLSAGLITAIPLSLAIVILFGLMGYFRVSLDVATALLSSIMIGVGVDYTIHFLWRYREEMAGGLRPAIAVKKTLTTTGRGITFNALSVILGFSALPFSSFPPIRFFGFLVIISIFACMIGALVIIPSLVIVFRPDFLESERITYKGNFIIRMRLVYRRMKNVIIKKRTLADFRRQITPPSGG